MRTIAFFNNKGGVGKTSLVYHLAWMFRERGLRVVAVDLDPQANLTSMFLDEPDLEAIWPEGGPSRSVLGALEPLKEGIGDIASPHLEAVEDGLAVLPGDLGLATFEGDLSENWAKCLEGDQRAFRIESAFWRLIEAAATSVDAHVALIDVGPNLGAINRAALIAAEFVVVPLGPDLFSLQGLRNLGPTLRTWRAGWQERLGKRPSRLTVSLPEVGMRPVGYVLMRLSFRLDRTTKAHGRWIARMPGEYRKSVLAEPGAAPASPSSDANCLAELKDYRSLMAMAQDARKPMFLLTSADGAIGGHQKAVSDCYNDFRQLATRIAERCSLSLR
jgi:cellulose biosynthesis protein BcsQ